MIVTKREMTIEEIKAFHDSSAFTVWKSPDGYASLQACTNGWELRIDDIVYRIGEGYGPEKYPDGMQPVFKTKLLDTVIKL
jgi:hypothetical protein